MLYFLRMHRKLIQSVNAFQAFHSQGTILVKTFFTLRPHCIFLCSNTCKILASTQVPNVLQLRSSLFLIFLLDCRHAFLPPLNTGTWGRCSSGNSSARTHEEVNWCFPCSCMVKWPEIPLLLPSFCHLCPSTVPFIPISTPTFYACSGISVLGVDEAQFHLIHNSLN